MGRVVLLVCSHFQGQTYPVLECTGVGPCWGPLVAFGIYLETDPGPVTPVRLVTGPGSLMPRAPLVFCCLVGSQVASAARRTVGAGPSCLGGVLFGGRGGRLNRFQGRLGAINDPGC